MEKKSQLYVLVKAKELTNYLITVAEKGIPVAEYYYALINYRRRIKGADLGVAEEHFKKCLQHCSLGIAKKIFLVTSYTRKNYWQKKYKKRL